MAAANISLVRIIPFDVGTPLSGRALRRFVAEVGRCPELSPSTSDNPTLFHNFVRSWKFTKEARILELYLFSEGTGVFYLEEPTISLENVSDCDPESINSMKSDGNHRILRGEHECSELIYRITDAARENSNSLRKRPSGFSDFEYQGLSYVFSFVFAHVQEITLVTNIDPLLRLCLFPRYSYGSGVEGQRGETSLFERVYDYTAPVETRLRDRSSGIEISLLEDTPSVKAAASWSSLVVVGELNQNIKDYYKKAEIELQRIWFLTYVIPAQSCRKKDIVQRI